MVEFPIVDTHLHLWDPKRLHYPWLSGVPLLNRPYLLADFNTACGPMQVEQMIFLQCEVQPSEYQKELAWVTSLATEDPRIAGIVPWAPLEKGDHARAELAVLAGNRLVKGVRRIIQFEPDCAFCLRPDFIRGVQLLADFDLHFELCLKGDEQFRNVVRLVQQCPQVRFILDHIGKPFIKERILEPWKSLLKTLAEQSNTWCKISGLATEADFNNWTSENLKPYIAWVLECFGWERVMFGGDWPVACQATDYTHWIETLHGAVPDASGPQLKKLFYHNAVAFYRLAARNMEVKTT